MLQLNLFGGESESEQENSRCYQAGFPVNRTALRASVKRLLMSVICGASSQELYTILSPDGYWVKMCGDCLVQKMDGSLDEFCGTWTKWGIMSGGAVTELPKLERGTGGNGCSLLPTPTVNGNYNRKGASKHSGDGLATVVKMFPTPTVADSKNVGFNGSHQFNLHKYVALYPTPTTGAGLCGGTGNYQQLMKLEANGIITEEERRNMSQGNGGKLNPTWVEWLMGFPTEWTDLNA